MSPIPSQLIEAAAQGDEKACADLLQRCEGLVRAAIRRSGYYFVNSYDEEDLRADLRYQILRSLPAWRAEQGGFSAWVNGIARNLLRSYVRARRAAPTVVDLDRVPASVGSGSRTPEGDRDPSLVVDLRAIIESMSPTDRTVVEHMMRDEPRRHLAEDLGISVDAAKMRVCRVRQRLRRSLVARRGPDPTRRRSARP